MKFNFYDFLKDGKDFSSNRKTSFLLTDLKNNKDFLRPVISNPSIPLYYNHDSYMNDKGKQNYNFDLEGPDPGLKFDFLNMIGLSLVKSLIGFVSISS